MTRTRGPNTREDIVREILLIKKLDEFNKIKPNELKQLLLKKHKAKLVPSERVIYNIIKKNKDKLFFNPIDKSFSIGACSTHDYLQHFPPESIARIFKMSYEEMWPTEPYTDEELSDKTDQEKKDIKDEFEEASRHPFFTIRLAKWFVRLVPVVSDLIADEFVKKYKDFLLKGYTREQLGDKYDNKGVQEWIEYITKLTRDDIVDDYALDIAQIYAYSERISEVLGEIVFNTFDLDKEYFRSGHLDLDKFRESRNKHLNRIFDLEKKLSIED